MKSAILKQMPENIIVIACHDFANVATKLTDALSSKFNVKYVNPSHENKKRMQMIYGLPPKKTLILFVEPGELRYKPDITHDSFLFPTIAGVKRPDNIPFGLYWCGSIYRVSNYAAWQKIPKIHNKLLVDRRTYFNSLTPLRMCATKDLTIIGRGSTYVGEPYNVPDEQPPISFDHKILHVPTTKDRTNIFKGTHRIRRAFKELKDQDIVKTKIFNKRVPYKTVLKEMKSSTMLIHAMNDYGGDIGYAGIEGISYGCVVFNKQKPHVKHPVVDVQKPGQLVNKVKHLVENPDEYERIRKLQFEWAKKNLSPEGVCKSVQRTIRKTIKMGWK